ncbi:hypothetical protein NDU88_001413 [Pleurodeles waltl]|uniref:Uncharacterized protein n=1 Tax=Pleurodeles waltl TaxID=8319 RepID=A0AAV7L0P0_PLEWA|nr:hypothetical protein NDU88_001413 [Pleurodeles waltl]
MGHVVLTSCPASSLVAEARAAGPACVVPPVALVMCSRPEAYHPDFHPGSRRLRTISHSLRTRYLSARPLATWLPKQELRVTGEEGGGRPRRARGGTCTPCLWSRRPVLCYVLHGAGFGWPCRPGDVEERDWLPGYREGPRAACRESGGPQLQRSPPGEWTVGPGAQVPESEVAIQRLDGSPEGNVSQCDMLGFSHQPDEFWEL